MRAVASWILYDVANVIFTTGVVSLRFPLFVPESVGAPRRFRVWQHYASRDRDHVAPVAAARARDRSHAPSHAESRLGNAAVLCVYRAHRTRPVMVSIVLFVPANGGNQA